MRQLLKTIRVVHHHPRRLRRHHDRTPDITGTTDTTARPVSSTADHPHRDPDDRGRDPELGGLHHDREHHRATAPGGDPGAPPGRRLRLGGCGRGHDCGDRRSTGPDHGDPRRERLPDEAERRIHAPPRSTRFRRRICHWRKNFRMNRQYELDKTTR
ncbi:hypothetical protein PLANTIT3_100175 [Plantibacter sp. T3]|nr:hypothetical protein PLANTIT3_100175 [Plantibacter sp. T3]